MKNFKYENEVISCVNEIVSEKFSDVLDLLYDTTEPYKTVFKSKNNDAHCEVNFGEWFLGGSSVEFAYYDEGFKLYSSNESIYTLTEKEIHNRIGMFAEQFA